MPGSVLRLCSMTAVLSFTILQVDGACSVTVDGMLATPEHTFGVKDDTAYVFQTVYEFNKVLDIAFLNEVDTWREDEGVVPPQRFQLHNSTIMKVCTKSDSVCRIDYKYEEPFALHMPGRFHLRRELLMIISQAREVCRLTLVIAPRAVDIDFDLSWTNRSIGYEMKIVWKKGFPGPFDYSTSCIDTPVRNLSNGVILILMDDLDTTGIKKCSVTVSSRFAANSKTREISVPSRPYSAYGYSTSTQSASKPLQPWKDATVATTFLASVLLAAVVIMLVVLLRRNKCCHSSVTLNNHLVTDSAVLPPNAITPHSPSMDDDSSSCLSQDSLETDGPSQQTKSTVASNSDGTAARVSLPMAQLPSKTQAGSSLTSKSSCSVLAQPAEESQRDSKPGRLDELASG